MSFLIEHQTIVLLTVLTVINMTAVLVVAKMKQTVQPRISRKSMLERIKAQQKTMRAWMENPELDARFKEAGYPLRLTGSSFQKWRLGLWILTLTYVSFSVYAQRDDLSVLFALRQIGLLASVYMFTSQRFFLKSILKQCRELYIAEKNRELFMVYSIIRDEFLAAKGQSRNLLGILEDVKEYTDKIRPALDKAIIHYVDGTRRAMEGMAKEIDTPEAEDLCAILAED